MSPQDVVDPVADVLTKSKLPDPVRAQVWDMYQAAANEDDLAAKLKGMPLPDSVKADLWDLKYGTKTPPPPPTAPVPDQSSSGGVLLGAAGKAGPVVARLAQEVATNPQVPRVAAKVGRVMGGIAPIVAGAAEGGPVGALVGIAAASKGAWAGGKTGWFTGKLAQNLTGPVANVLIKVEPYMQTLSTLAGPQSALDLAQLADPKRRDIGFLGVGATEHVPGQHPALLNLAAQKIGDSIKSLMGYGLKAEDAAALLLDAHGGGK